MYDSSTASYVESSRSMSKRDLKAQTPIYSSRLCIGYQLPASLNVGLKYIGSRNPQRHGKRNGVGNGMEQGIPKMQNVRTRAFQPSSRPKFGVVVLLNKL